MLRNQVCVYTYLCTYMYITPKKKKNNNKDKDTKTTKKTHMIKKRRREVDHSGEREIYHVFCVNGRQNQRGKLRDINLDPWICRPPVGGGPPNPPKKSLHNFPGSFRIHRNDRHILRGWTHFALQICAGTTPLSPKQENGG